MSKNLLFIRKDVHKYSIEIAMAESMNTEVRRYEKVGVNPTMSMTASNNAKE